jgi:predicted transport protein
VKDPSILGLGEVDIRDKERIQPHAGRLDLLLQEIDSNRRFEIELQLGKTDESHIIRTVEYWDIERKRYPQYDHTAVIIAEDITSRFLNVIQLFNGYIPIIALQMNAFELDGEVGLSFTKVIDKVMMGLVEEDEELTEVVDRNYWESLGSPETLKLADTMLDIIKTFEPQCELKYNKYYIGLSKNGTPLNFVVFRAKKNNLRMELAQIQSKELTDKFENSGLDLMDYDVRYNRYRIRLTKQDIEKHRDFLEEIMAESYKYWTT